MRRTTGIVEGSLLFDYLGVPLFTGIPRASHLQGLEDKVLAQLSRWKGSSLSLLRADGVSSIALQQLLWYIR